MGFLKSLFKEEKKCNVSNKNELKDDNKISLRKDIISKICLEKKELNNLTCKVVVVLDYSVSMRSLYTNGDVQKILERVLPLGLNFDNDGKVETWLFNDGFNRINDLSISNYKDYIENEKIMDKYKLGGTRYCPVMKEIVKTSKIDSAITYVFFVTDGDNCDKKDTGKFIVEASKEPVFFQFIGIGKGPFLFLEELDNLKGRVVDNACFLNTLNIDKMSDTELYNEILKEYPLWLKEAKLEKIIK